MSQDPVCGMEVTHEKHVLEHAGRRLLFCGSGCRKAFAARPQKYLDPDYRPSMGGAFLDWVRALLRSSPG